MVLTASGFGNSVNSNGNLVWEHGKGIWRQSSPECMTWVPGGTIAEFLAYRDEQ